MAYSERLEAKLDAATARWSGLQKKKMFGGVGYLLNGNMCVGIWKDNLIVRLGREQAAQSMQLTHVRPFDITGRTMSGWLMVREEGWKNAAVLRNWVARAKRFAGALPEKSTKARKRTLREHHG